MTHLTSDDFRDLATSFFPDLPIAVTAREDSEKAIAARLARVLPRLTELQRNALAETVISLHRNPEIDAHYQTALVDGLPVNMIHIDTNNLLSMKEFTELGYPEPAFPREAWACYSFFFAAGYLGLNHALGITGIKDTRIAAEHGRERLAEMFATEPTLADTCRFMNATADLFGCAAAAKLTDAPMQDLLAVVGDVRTIVLDPYLLRGAQAPPDAFHSYTVPLLDRAWGHFNLDRLRQDPQEIFPLCLKFAGLQLAQWPGLFDLPPAIPDEREMTLPFAEAVAAALRLHPSELVSVPPVIRVVARSLQAFHRKKMFTPSGREEMGMRGLTREPDSDLPKP